MSNTSEQILAIVASVLEIQPSEISPIALFDDLGIDTFDVSSIVMRVEDELKVKIPEGVELRIRGIAGLTVLVEQYLKDQS